MTGASSAPILTFGPGRSASIAMSLCMSEAILLMVSAVAAPSSFFAWEKFTRTMSAYFSTFFSVPALLMLGP